MNRGILLGLLLLMIRPCAAAEAVDETLLARAIKGDASAQASLGLAYETGQGAPQDAKQAAAWYQQAADQGLDFAIGKLALMYAAGIGVPKDLVQAAKLYRTLAAKGIVPAEVALGGAYYDGVGVPKDRRQAFEWFRSAAYSADCAGQYMLAKCFYSGEGVARDEVEALAWLSLSAENGYTDSVAARDKLARQLTPVQLVTARERATQLANEISARRKASTAKSHNEPNAR